VSEDEVGRALSRLPALTRNQPRDAVERDDVVRCLFPQPIEEAALGTAFHIRP
jgi:hypothetical protein